VTFTVNGDAIPTREMQQVIKGMGTDRRIFQRGHAMLKVKCYKISIFGTVNNFVKIKK